VAVHHLAVLLGFSALAASCSPTSTLLTPQNAGVRTDAACSSCHARIVAIHSASLHGRAASNDAFRASLARSPDAPWCLACHAPTSLLEGVGCSGCHELDGTHRDRSPPSARCVGCHEVPFPPSTTWPGAPNAQTTSQEHGAIGGAPACSACHTAGHAWRGRELLPGALVVGVSRTGVDAVAVTLTTTAHVAHAVPTGDPFRVLEVRLCADDACAFVVATHALARDVQHERVRDTRPRPGFPARVDFAADAALPCFVDVRVRSVENGTPSPSTRVGHVPCP
jgi:hypothetical protein